MPLVEAPASAFVADPWRDPDEENARLRATVSAASAANPDTVATQRRLAGYVGFPAAVGEAQPDEVKRLATIDKVAADTAPHPPLQRRYTDRDFARLAHDDSGPLSAVAEAARYLVSAPGGRTLAGDISGYAGAFMPGWRTADLQAAITDLSMVRVEGKTLTPEQETRRQDLKRQVAEIAGQRAEGETPLEFAARTQGYSARQGASSLLARAKGVGYGGVAGLVLGAPTGLGVPVTAGAGMVVGGAMAAGMYAYRMEAGSFYEELSDSRDLTGRPIPDDIARSAAQVVGLVNAAIEVGSDTLALKLLPGAEKFIATVTGKRQLVQAIKTAALDPAKHTALRAGLKALASTSFIEGAEEFFQQFVQAGGRDIARAWSGQEFKPVPFSQDLQEAFGAQLEATVGTALTFGAFSGAANYVAARRAQTQAQVDSANQAGQALQNVAKLSGKTALLNRSPEVFRDTLNELAADTAGAPQVVRFDAEALVGALAQSGMDRAELEAKFPEVAKQLPEALAMGGEVSIPVGDYVTGVIGTPLEQALQEHARVGDNEYSQAEAADIVKEAEKALAQDSERVLAQAENADELRASGEAVKAQVLERLTAAGRNTADVNEAYATLWQHFFTVVAPRAGTTPEELFNRYNPRIQAVGPEGEALSQVLPGRIPTAVGAAPNLLDIGVPDLATLQGNPTQLRNAVQAVLAEPGMREPGMRLRNDSALAEYLIERMKDNLLWLHDQMPEAIRARAKLWYEGASSIADRFANRWGKTKAQAAGILAALSPQKDWFMNTSLGERVGDTLMQKGAHRWDDKMDAAAFKFLLDTEGKADPEAAKNKVAYERAKGKTLDEVLDAGNPRVIGVWLRAYDEAYHSPSHAVVTPEGGFAEPVTTAAGAQARRAWGDFVTIGKAASIFMDGSAANISRQLGDKHKVRNFYNNIFNPADPRFTTIDTHAVAAALLRPLAGADQAVADNFGKTGSDRATGVSGSYPLYYEAYKRAAEERGLLPREMQSITWEAVRGLFPDTFKTEENKFAVDEIWRRYGEGDITLDEARQHILESAGGIQAPDWWHGADAHLTETLNDTTYRAKQVGEELVGAKATFEVAPNPDDAALKARWEALSPQDRAQISHEIAWWASARTMATMLQKEGKFDSARILRGELHRQVGAYGDDQNASFLITLAPDVSGPKALQLANALGYVLGQKETGLVTPKKITGTDRMGVIHVALGKDAAQVEQVYKTLRELGHDKITGHSTAGGDMAILVDEAKAGMTAEALGRQVDAKLGGKYNVTFDHVYAAWLGGERGYDLPGQKTAGGNGAESPVRANLDRIRDEAARRLESAIAARSQPAAAGQAAQRAFAESLAQSAFHGGPHRFAKFSTEYIGTGEGAQAYGWGLYFAGRKEIAEHYRELLSSRDEKGYVDAHLNAKRLVEKFKGDAEWAAEVVKEQRDQLQPGDENYRRLDQTLKFIESGEHAKPLPPKGQLYEAEIPDDAHMLLWDKPLSEQPQAVRKALKETTKTDALKGQWITGAMGERRFVEPGREMMLGLERMTGEEAYRRLQDALGGNAKAASDALAAAGIKGIKYLDNTSRTAGEGTHNYVVFSGDDVAIKQTFYQGVDVDRGGYSFRGGERMISLLQNADLTTFLHESGHFFLDVLSDLASMPDAPAGIVDDFNAVLKWVGMTAEEWRADTAEYQATGKIPDRLRAAHEKWAEGFEQYLFEGKAPSVELRGVFHRFKSWLTSVYGSLKKFMQGRSAAGDGPALAQSSDAQGADLGESVTLYHGSPSAVGAIRDEGLFGGLFASASKQSAASHGDVLHRVVLRESDILTQSKIEEVTDEQLKNAAPWVKEDDLDRLRDLVVYDKAAEDDDARIMRTDDAGEASWEAQRVRGVIAKLLGFKAVEMTDEHGRTYLVLPGVPIGPALAQSGIDQTDTPTFRAWFGGSKVVDAQGKPLVVYHGTEKAGFDVFDPARAGGNTRRELDGIYFTNKKLGAETYSGTRRDAAPRADFDPEDASPGNYPVYLRMKNPLEVDFEGRNFDGSTADDPFGDDGQHMDSLVRQARESGHDGLIARNIMDEGRHGQGYGWGDTTYVVFEPEQIKSATGNSGAFDPSNPSILAQSASSGGRLRISPEIRGVMDRLLATEEQIAEAEHIAGFEAIYRSADEAGMTPEEWDAYQAKNAEAHNDAVDSMQARSLADLKWATKAYGKALKRLQAGAEDIRKAVQAEVAAEVADMPVERARAMIRELRVTSPEFKDALKDWKNRREAALERASAEVKAEYLSAPEAQGLKGLELAQYQARNAKLIANEAERRALLWERDNRRPMPDLPPLEMDMIAGATGFASGDELRTALLESPDARDLVEGMTEQRLLERYGDLVTPAGIAEAAAEAVHNEARARFIATELATAEKALAVTTDTGKTARGGRRLTVNAAVQAAKNFAEELIGRRQIIEIKPAGHRQAETRAAREARRAMMKGDQAGVVARLRDELLQHYAAMFSSQALAEVDKGVAYLKKFDNEGTRKNLAGDYIDQIDKILERMDLRKATTAKAISERIALAKFIASQEEVGLETDIPEDLLESVQARSYKEMTLEEFRGMVDAVRQIERLGRLKQRLLTARDKREFREHADDFAEGVAANAKGEQQDTRTPNTRLGKALIAVKEFRAAHILAAGWARTADGGKDNGVVWNTLIRPANAAGDLETSLRGEHARKAADNLDPVIKRGGMQGKGRYFPHVKRWFNREAILAMAVNTGNDSNLRRLLDGEGWTIDKIQPMLDTLTADDWRSVQAIWDHFESLRPQVVAAYDRMGLKQPEWLTPAPRTVQTADGQTVELRGGYYPVKYDPRASVRAGQDVAAEEGKMLTRAAYTASTTRNSYTKSRVKQVTGRPLLYSLDGYYNGLNEVIHDLAWHEWVIDASRLLRDQKAADAIRTHYGPEQLKSLTDWVADIATDGYRMNTRSEAIWSFARQNVSFAGLAFNFLVAAIQPLGILNAIPRIGIKWVTRGVAAVVADPIAVHKHAVENAVFMAHRSETRLRELDEVKNRVKGRSKAAEAWYDAGYALTSWGQHVADLATWRGAYEKAVSEGNGHDTAVALAVQAVIDSQGGGQLKDLTAFERGSPAEKLFTVFMHFPITVFNQLSTQTATRDSKAALAMDYVLLGVIPALLVSQLRDALTPGDEDDEKGIVRRMLGELLGYFTGMIYGVRDLGGAIANQVQGNPYGTDYTGPVGLRLLSDTAKLTQQVGQWEWDDAARKAVVNFVGSAFRLPSAQINRSWTGLEAYLEGETENPAAILTGYQGR